VRPFAPFALPLFALAAVLVSCVPDGSSVPFDSWQGGALCAGCVANGEVTDDGDGDGFCEDDTTCTDGAETGDCDDNLPEVAPTLPEVCDGLDNDCDGIVGSGPLQTYEYDQATVGFLDDEGLFAGGLFTSVSAVRVSDIGLRVGADAGNEVTWYVFESENLEEPMLPIAQVDATLADGVGWISANGIDAPLRPGRYYAIGAWFHPPPDGNAATQVLFDPNGDQLAEFTGWGTHVEGLALTWPGGPPASFSEWTVNAAFLIRVDTGGFIDGDNDGNGVLDCEEGDDDDSGDDDDTGDDDDDTTMDDDDTGDDDDVTVDDDDTSGCVDCDNDGYTVVTDCDDTNPAINPGAIEVARDGIDNDCDGVVDRGCGCATSPTPVTLGWLLGAAVFAPLLRRRRGRRGARAS